jgi:protein involved in polysaccharide export with SLBB domain
MKFRAVSFILVLFGFFHFAAGAHADYRLDVGDKVRIKVYEWPDLNGEYAVGPSGSVFLSLVGEINARMVTPAELASQISTRLQERARLAEPPSATVEVVEFRPFFILGDVQAPGEYSYRPGMTTLQALSIAGGKYRRSDMQEGRFARETITSIGNLSLLELKRIRLEARIARLNAQLAEEEIVQFPPDLLERQSDPLVASLLEEEKLMLTLQQQAHRDEQVTELDLQKLVEAEVVSLERELESVDDQLRSADKELEDVRSLVARGLTPAPRQLGLERMVANIAAQRSGIETSILRARQNARQSRQRAATLAAERRERALQSRQEASVELEAARQESVTTRRLLLDSEESVAGLQFDLDEQPVYTYRVTRQTEGRVESFEAERMTPVQPGDIIEVIREDLPRQRIGARSRQSMQEGANLLALTGRAGR